jgi:hypothetical protein
MDNRSCDVYLNQILKLSPAAYHQKLDLSAAQKQELQAPRYFFMVVILLCLLYSISYCSMYWS